MANKKFLEETPLYSKFKTDLRFKHRFSSGLKANSLPKPAIHMYCKDCSSDQTFNMNNEYYDGRNNADEVINKQVKEVIYLCSSCRVNQRIFLISFSVEKENDDSMNSILVLEKVGQIPAWDIKMDHNLESVLGDYASHYKKGLICESQSYGIGSYAYFRRVTEDIIDKLLDSIPDLLEGEDKEKYTVALQKTKETRITQEKIDLVKDLLPNSLRPNGLNPLDALHSALSEGLHAEDDKTCLRYADAIKEVLIYLVNQIIKKKEDSKKFTDGMKKLLDKKLKIK